MMNFYFFLKLIFTFSILIIGHNSYKYQKHTNIIEKSGKYKYDVKYFKTYVDHFSYKNDSETFLLRYLISTANWVKENPIFFYCGNEGDITVFAENSGFVWELAEQLSGMVVFAEHRYYGVSLPFGNLSLSDPKHFGYLNAEQTLADYANLITYLKSTIDQAESSPVIAFGGSYGGMLAAWFRQKYPNIVAGSLASSAPVLMVDRLANCSKAFEILTEAYRRKGSQTCVNNVRNVWVVIQNMNNSMGLANLTKIFRTCKPLKKVDYLKDFLSDGLFSMGMGNYPYPTTFLGPMPAWPVTEFCKHLSTVIRDPIELLKTFYDGMQVFFNYTGQLPCLSVEANATAFYTDAWEIQTCTELPIPMCTNGITDMFYMNNFSKIDNDKQCQIKYGVKPRWGWGETLFWGNNLKAASNIIFSSGLLDPWFAGGITSPPSDSIQIIQIENGAHHVDLRSANPYDTVDIRLARKLEKLIIEKWIVQWYKDNY